MGLETGKWTKAINSISDKLNESKIANNKYFNHKDAMFIGTTAAGAAIGYGASGGDKDQTINGGIFGAAGGLLHRQGFEGLAKGASRALRTIGKVSDDVTKVEGGIIDNATGNMHLLPLGLNHIASMNTSKEGMLYGAGMLGFGALTGAIGGWAGGEAGMGTTATGGAIEGAALGIFVPAMMAKTALGGGGASRQISNVAIGKVAAISGMLAGGYEGFQGEDGGFSKALLKGALYGKLGQSVGMLGMERYGKGVSGKIAESKFGRMMGG